MLDPDAIDLDELCIALDDRADEHSWWISPTTGEIKPHIPDVDGDSSPEEDGWCYIHPLSSHDAYRVMEDFVAAVPDRRAADLLDRAIIGRAPSAASRMRCSTCRSCATSGSGSATRGPPGRRSTGSRTRN